MTTSMSCDLCQGQYQKKMIVLSFQRKGKSVVVEGVPGLVCNRCGDTLLSGEVVSEVEKLLEERPHGSAPLYKFHEKVA